PFASASSTAWRTSLVRNPFVSPELCPSDAMASSRSIYATTPISYLFFPFLSHEGRFSNFKITNCGSICNNASRKNGL
ncbi:MAG: hypothetical protein VB140_02040, partial [Burkholderia sp.]